MLNSDRMAPVDDDEGSLLVGGPLGLATLVLGLALSLLLLVAGHGADQVLRDRHKSVREAGAVQRSDCNTGSTHRDRT